MNPCPLAFSLSSLAYYSVPSIVRDNMLLDVFTGEYNSYLMIVVADLCFSVGARDIGDMCGVDQITLN